jgi:K+-transporting ATPase KdpF subunit
MMAYILILVNKPVEADISAGYTAGAVIGILILAYLLYSLIKPEKF